MKNEPVLNAAAVAAAIIAIASYFGVVLDASFVNTVVVALLPIVAALIARNKVTPVK